MVRGTDELVRFGAILGPHVFTVPVELSADTVGDDPRQDRFVQGSAVIDVRVGVGAVLAGRNLFGVDAETHHGDRLGRIRALRLEFHRGRLNVPRGRLLLQPVIPQPFQTCHGFDKSTIGLWVVGHLSAVSH